MPAAQRAGDFGGSEAIALTELLAAEIPPRPFALMWSSPDVVGLFSINVVSFSRNVVLSGPLFSLNVVWKRAMLSVRIVYVLSLLHLLTR
jgi:hypothetical protein